MSLEVHTIPVISTAHITREVAERLDSEHQNWCACSVYRDVGFFLYLDEPDGSDEPVPQCLLDIRDWRMRLEREGKLDNSRWVRLDCDADTADGLPTYDW